MVRFDRWVMGLTCCCFLQVPLKSRSWCISWTEMLLLDSPFPPHWKPTRPIPWSTMWWESMWGLKTQCLLVWKWIMRWEELHLPLLSFDLCSYLFFICHWGALAASAIWGSFHFSQAYWLFGSPSARMGKSVLSWWFFFAFQLCQNMPVFLVWTSLVQLPASLLASILLLLKTVCPCISFASPFNTVFQRHLHAFCFRKQTMIQQVKLQPTHNRHWHFMNWTWVWTTLSGNTVSPWKSMATSS